MPFLPPYSKSFSGKHISSESSESSRVSHLLTNAEDHDGSSVHRPRGGEEGRCDCGDPLPASYSGAGLRGRRHRRQRVSWRLIIESTSSAAGFCGFASSVFGSGSTSTRAGRGGSAAEACHYPNEETARGVCLLRWRRDLVACIRSLRIFRMNLVDRLTPVLAEVSSSVSVGRYRRPMLAALALTTSEGLAAST